MLRKLVILSFILFCIVSCARITGNIEGGPEDTFAPVLDESKSSPNFQKNFTAEPLYFYFDEWLQLKNQNNILVSPPLKHKPKIELRGKKLTFEFNEEEILADSTTYVINFGESIVDFTEGNPAKDLRFIFSTGDEIDSLFIQGRIRDVLTNEPLEDILVCLYDTLRDSIVVQDRPLYITKTNEAGEFRLSNLREDTFQLFAIEDNFNYKFDPPAERIAFLDSTIYVREDSVTQVFELDLFLMDDYRLLSHSFKKANRLSLLFSNLPDSVNLINEAFTSIYQESSKDSFHIWYTYQEPMEDSLLILHDDGGNVLDTIRWKEASYKDSLQLEARKNNKLFKVNPNGEIAFNYNVPISIADTSLISLKDTLDVSAAYIAKTVGKNLKFSLSLKDQTIYNLTILPGAITDLYGQTNDTLLVEISTASKEDFGNLQIAFNAENDSISYLCQLRKGEKIIDNFLMKSSEIKVYQQIEPGKYNIKLIEDINGNGRWDSGDWFEKRQPEKIKTIEVEEIRANWDVELSIDWDIL